VQGGDAPGRLGHVMVFAEAKGVAAAYQASLSRDRRMAKMTRSLASRHVTEPSEGREGVTGER